MAQTTYTLEHLEWVKNTHNKLFLAHEAAEERLENDWSNEAVQASGDTWVDLNEFVKDHADALYIIYKDNPRNLY